MPNNVLKKICDYYFEHRKYHVLERIVSCLNFSKYDNLDELEAVCSMKQLTTTLIHLIITSNQSKEDACKKILTGVFNCFQGINNRVSLEDIKNLHKKDQEEAYGIAASYEYIGLKLMHILKLYIRGERFPEGKLPKESHYIYLSQSIGFLIQNEIATELIQVNARSFFIVVSEIYLNKQVSSMLVELNEEVDEAGRLTCPTTHQLLTKKLLEITDRLSSTPNIKFEYCYFVIKISLAECYKSNPQQFVAQATSSIQFVLDEILAFYQGDEVNRGSETRAANNYIGPGEIELSELEQEILDVLHTYSSFMNGNQLDGIISAAKELKIDKLRIHIYEQRGDFDLCMATYLHSEGCKTEDIFPWLRNLHKRISKLDEESVNKIKEVIIGILDQYFYKCSCFPRLNSWLVFGTFFRVNKTK